MEVFFSNLFDVSGRKIIKHLSRRGAAVARRRRLQYKKSAKKLEALNAQLGK